MVGTAIKKITNAVRYLPSAARHDQCIDEAIAAAISEIIVVVTEATQAVDVVRPQCTERLAPSPAGIVPVAQTKNFCSTISSLSGPRILRANDV